MFSLPQNPIYQQLENIPKNRALGETQQLNNQSTQQAIAESQERIQTSAMEKLLKLTKSQQDMQSKLFGDLTATAKFFQDVSKSMSDKDFDKFVNSFSETPYGQSILQNAGLIQDGKSQLNVFKTKSGIGYEIPIVATAQNINDFPPSFGAKVGKEYIKKVEPGTGNIIYTDPDIEKKKEEAKLARELKLTQMKENIATAAQKVRDQFRTSNQIAQDRTKAMSDIKKTIATQKAIILKSTDINKEDKPALYRAVDALFKPAIDEIKATVKQKDSLGLGI